MRFLLTNDDGIAAPGLAALYRAIAPLGAVHVVAPSKVRSACGHAVTFHRGLEAWTAEMVDHEGQVVGHGTALQGMPADCVKVGLARLIDGPVDLVISGINAGCNVGVHTLYSGTVAAAREAAIAGVPALAVSLFLDHRDDIRWQRASELFGDCLRRILAHPLAAGTLLNINIPILDHGAEPRGVRVVPTNQAAMIDDYQGEPDGDGRLELTVGRQVSFGEFDAGSDAELLFDGYITITPMHFDLTDHDRLTYWRTRFDDL